MIFTAHARKARSRAVIVPALVTAILLSTGGALAGGYDKTGIASWYGKRYHGRTTANGESFDMNALTAAHRRLPFGTMVRVTNLGNRRSLVVRINDRGPYAGNRIIDLSRRAAAILGFQQQGLTKVRVQTVKTASPKQRRYKKRRNKSVSTDGNILQSLARSQAYQPATLRPPRY